MNLNTNKAGDDIDGDDTAGIAAMLSDLFLSSHKIATKDWIVKDLGRRPPEEPVERLLDLLAESNLAAMKWQMYAMSFACNRRNPEVTPSVVVETVGRQIRLSVSHDGTWIGSLVVYTAGGEAACKLRDNFVTGSYLEMNGAVASSIFCFNPAHHPEVAA